MLLGRLYLFVDECTTQKLRVSFARVLIEVDVTRSLPNNITRVDASGGEFAQNVTYDWRSAYCKQCCMVGYNCGGEPKGIPRL